MLRTHLGPVSGKHIDAYLADLPFRRNRCNSRDRGLLTCRLMNYAVWAGPHTHDDLTLIGENLRNLSKTSTRPLTLAIMLSVRPTQSRS